MELIKTSIPDVVIVEPAVYKDERGWFMESYNEHKFQEGLKSLGLPRANKFVQDNHSFSKKGVLRGLHFQRPPYEQGKLVRVVSGAAFDVAVDIRRESETFGKWVGVLLTAENKRSLWIPEGFAHGFLSLEDNTAFLYKTTNIYCKDFEGAVNWNDPDIGIAWPLSDSDIFLSDKDSVAPSLRSLVL